VPKAGKFFNDSRLQQNGNLSKGPYTIARVHANGTVTIQKDLALQRINSMYSVRRITRSVSTPSYNLGGECSRHAHWLTRLMTWADFVSPTCHVCWTMTYSTPGGRLKIMLISLLLSSSWWRRRLTTKRSGCQWHLLLTYWIGPIDGIYIHWHML
jgi:hypothetical protein